MPSPPREPLGPQSFLLPGFLMPQEARVLEAVAHVIEQASFRRMTTPGGYLMGVEMTNCGPKGWTSGPQGYRYTTFDPVTSQPWPTMPPIFMALAKSASRYAGFPGFEPDACLINRYRPGVKLSLHQDKDERDFAAPIVSVSLGLPATFLFGGLQRTDTIQKVKLVHGDVVVWGGSDRLRFHGVSALKAGTHPVLGGHRINLTFRKAS